MGRLRLIATLPYTSGLPEDVVVNTFHFITQSTPIAPADLASCMNRVDEFYRQVSPGAANAVGEWISPLVSRVANACTVEAFDVDDPEPRQPIGSLAFTLPAPDTNFPAPPEVALCLSYTALPISGVPQSRRRGRVFLGPFITAANDGTGRPAAQLRTDVAVAADDLKDTIIAGGNRWAVYSRVGDAMAEIISGWVDDEWDTMRSRGRRSTTRTLW